MIRLQILKIQKQCTHSKVFTTYYNNTHKIRICIVNNKMYSKMLNETNQLEMEILNKYYDIHLDEVKVYEYILG